VEGVGTKGAGRAGLLPLKASAALVRRKPRLCLAAELVPSRLARTKLQTVLDSERPIMVAHPGRPVAANLLHVKRRVARVTFEEFVRAICERLSLGRQRVVADPEIRRGVMIQSLVDFPAA
jgi:hypothetical protein